MSRDGDDVVLWPDGTRCRWEDIGQMSHSGDDYRVIPWEDPEADAIAEE